MDMALPNTRSASMILMPTYALSDGQDSSTLAGQSPLQSLSAGQNGHLQEEAKGIFSGHSHETCTGNVQGQSVHPTFPLPQRGSKRHGGQGTQSLIERPTHFFQTSGMRRRLKSAPCFSSHNANFLVPDIAALWQFHEELRSADENPPKRFKKDGKVKKNSKKSHHFSRKINPPKRFKKDGKVKKNSKKSHHFSKKTNPPKMFKKDGKVKKNSKNGRYFSKKTNPCKTLEPQEKDVRHQQACLSDVQKSDAVLNSLPVTTFSSASDFHIQEIRNAREILERIRTMRKVPKYKAVHSSPDYHLQKPVWLDSLLSMPPASEDVQKKHGWNINDKSEDMNVSADNLTVERNYVILRTDCVRGMIGYTRGLHVWEIIWNSDQRGTHAAIGVATRDAPLQCNGYRSLVGLTRDSCGWDIVNKQLYHHSIHTWGATYPLHPDFSENFIVSDSILVVLDMEEGTLSFVADGQYLGVACRGLKGKQLYPIVSAVFGGCEITMKYIGGVEPEPYSLKHICRKSIRAHLEEHSTLQAVHTLPIPSVVKNYLLYEY